MADWITELQNYLREVNPFNKQWGHPPDPDTLPIITRVPSGYQATPTSPNVVDRRNAPYDYRSALVAAPPAGPLSSYEASPLGGAAPNPFRSSDNDPMLNAAYMVDPNQPADVAPYRPSFRQNWRPAQTGQAPYQQFPFGPNLPRGPQGVSADPEMPYMGAHLPFSPGDPGWTPPPSPSGPHNPGGDPARPGYGDIFSSPQNVSPQQLAAALRAWGGWQ